MRIWKEKEGESERKDGVLPWWDLPYNTLEKKKAKSGWPRNIDSDERNVDVDGGNDKWTGD